MCIIIDTNVAHKFSQPPHADVKPVVSWLLNRKHLNQAVIGGKLKKELHSAGDIFRRFLRVLGEAGHLMIVPDDDVDEKEAEVIEQLEEEGINDADDPHVIALARVSGSRLLVSADSSSRLHEIFKSRHFLDPPGKIYQKPSHKHLLWKSPKCKRQAN